MDLDTLNTMLQSLKDLKLVVNQLSMMQSNYDNTDDDYYSLDTIISFIKFIFCRLRNTILKHNKDEYIKHFIQNNKSI